MGLLCILTVCDHSGQCRVCYMCAYGISQGWRLHLAILFRSVHSFVQLALAKDWEGWSCCICTAPRPSRLASHCPTSGRRASNCASTGSSDINALTWATALSCPRATRSIFLSTAELASQSPLCVEWTLLERLSLPENVWRCSHQWGSAWLYWPSLCQGLVVYHRFRPRRQWAWCVTFAGQTLFQHHCKKECNLCSWLSVAAAILIPTAIPCMPFSPSRASFNFLWKIS